MSKGKSKPGKEKKKPPQTKKEKPASNYKTQYGR